jgi:hypothetical protein
MFSWRWLLPLAALLVPLAGCRSAHIKDAYISRDENGVRRTDCIRPAWSQYYLNIEFYSFKDETLLWPYLVNASNNEVIAPPWGEGAGEELVEFGNVATGKIEGGDQSFRFFELDPQGEEKPLTPGRFRWDLYIDDEDAPRKSVGLAVDDSCPCTGGVCP